MIKESSHRVVEAIELSSSKLGSKRKSGPLSSVSSGVLLMKEGNSLAQGDAKQGEGIFRFSLHPLSYETIPFVSCTHVAPLVVPADFFSYRCRGWCVRHEPTHSLSSVSDFSHFGVGTILVVVKTLFDFVWPMGSALCSSRFSGV